MQSKLRYLFRRLITGLFILVLIAIPITLYMLQKMTTTSAGVNHHLMFKKTFYLRHYFTPVVLRVLPVIGVSLMLLITYYYVSVVKTRSFWQTAFFIVGTLYFVSLIALGLGMFSDLLVYAYALFGVVAGSVMAIIGLILWHRLDKK